MKKKAPVFTSCSIVVLALLLSISCFITFDGYCASLDFTRASESMYRKGHLMASVNETKEIIDFVIKNNELNIITISCEQKMFGNTYYNIRAKTTYNIDEVLTQYQKGTKNDWVTCKNLFSNTTVLWCIENEYFEFSAENCESFDYMYKDSIRQIFYRIE